jgi:hypothetical protein
MLQQVLRKARHIFYMPLRTLCMRHDEKRALRTPLHMHGKFWRTKHVRLLKIESLWLLSGHTRRICQRSLDILRRILCCPRQCSL